MGGVLTQLALSNRRTTKPVSSSMGGADEMRGRRAWFGKNFLPAVFFGGVSGEKETTGVVQEGQLRMDRQQ